MIYEYAYILIKRCVFYHRIHYSESLYLLNCFILIRSVFSFHHHSCYLIINTVWKKLQGVSDDDGVEERRQIDRSDQDHFFSDI